MNETQEANVGHMVKLQECMGTACKWGTAFSVKEWGRINVACTAENQNRIGLIGTLFIRKRPGKAQFN